MTFTSVVWTVDRVDTLRHMLYRKFSRHQIAATLGVTRRQLRAHLLDHYPEQIGKARVTPTIPVAADVIAERDRRLQVERDLTGQLMGDPPPGYSALDQRRTTERRP